MQKFINWILVIAACVGLFYGIGLIVPRATSHKAKIKLSADPRDLYALVADVSTWPGWYPGIAAVSARPAHDDHPVWLVTTKERETYELEITDSEKDSFLQASYSFHGKRCSLRIVFGWDGEGGRIHLTKSSDTPDPWARASMFFWPRDDSSPRMVLDAAAQRLGEENRSVDA